MHGTVCGPFQSYSWVRILSFSERSKRWASRYCTYLGSGWVRESSHIMVPTWANMFTSDCVRKGEDDYHSLTETKDQGKEMGHWWHEQPFSVWHRVTLRMMTLTAIFWEHRGVKDSRITTGRVKGFHQEKEMAARTTFVVTDTPEAQTWVVSQEKQSNGNNCHNNTSTSRGSEVRLHPLETWYMNSDTVFTCLTSTLPSLTRAHTNINTQNVNSKNTNGTCREKQ